ncbi:hypothetical protein B5P41_31545, partial [Bacillus sp. SRB_28]
GNADYPPAAAAGAGDGHRRRRLPAGDPSPPGGLRAAAAYRAGRRYPGRRMLAGNRRNHPAISLAGGAAGNGLARGDRAVSRLSAGGRPGERQPAQPVRQTPA